MWKVAWRVHLRSAARLTTRTAFKAVISATASKLDHMDRPSSRSMQSTTREALRVQLCPDDDHHPAICMMRRRRQRETSVGATMLRCPLPWLSSLRLSSLARTWRSISRAIHSNRDRDRDLLAKVTCVQRLQLLQRLPHIQLRARSPCLRHLARSSSRSGFLSRSAALQKRRSRSFDSIRQ